MISDTRWQERLKQAYRNPKDLLASLDIPVHEYQHRIDANNTFPLLVTQDFQSRMRKKDLQDPLLLQALPQLIENNTTHGVLDPIEEQPLTQSGLIHKYHGRALWVLSGGCAINCRYCFRRHFPYHQHINNGQAWKAPLNQIQADPSLREIILSGGDPLLLDDKKLHLLFEKLTSIAHIETIRIHSRLPIVLPSRITPMLLDIFKHSRLQVVFVIHCNHAQEIDEDVMRSTTQLHSVCHAVLNQSVLLKGVNDCADTLIELSHKLLASRVTPYYLHTLDPVQGAMHFNTDHQTQKKIMEELRRQLPGYLVPKCVSDIPGEPYKKIVA